MGNLGEEEPLQDGRGDREGFFDFVFSQPPNTLEDEVQRTVLRRSGHFLDIQHAADSANGTDVLGERCLGLDAAGGDTPLREEADIVIIDW